MKEIDTRIEDGQKRDVSRRLCAACGRRTSACDKCGHRTYCYFCNTCNLHGQDDPAPEMIRPAREPRGRLFVVQVSFETKRGWSDTFDMRIRAKGVAGAIWAGVRQARREHLKKGTHVRQVRVTAVGA